MFKSIQYKLTLFVGLLILSVAGLTYCITVGLYVYAMIPGLFLLVSLQSLHLHYKKFNQNILFLLNALDNGDYSFHFSETKLSKREKELNIMLNRIKDILTNARKEVIENEKFLSLILESVSTGIIIFNERGSIQSTNQSALNLLGLSVFTHIKQLYVVDESFPELFLHLTPGDSQQISVWNEREELQISLHTSRIKMKRGDMKIVTLNNIGNELASKEMDSWIKLIRVMTHEIMNSIAPITSLSETLLLLLRSSDSKDREESLKKNTIEAFETIHTTAKGLLSFVESYRKFTGIPKPEVRLFNFKELIDKIINLQSSFVREKGIEVSVVCELNDPEVLADEKLITQVLVNLIKNAVEAVESNEKIIIRLSKQNTRKPVIDICNTGKLISKEGTSSYFCSFFYNKKVRKRHWFKCIPLHYAVTWRKIASFCFSGRLDCF